VIGHKIFGSLMIVGSDSAVGGGPAFEPSPSDLKEIAQAGGIELGENPKAALVQIVRQYRIRRLRESCAPGWKQIQEDISRIKKAAKQLNEALDAAMVGTVTRPRLLDMGRLENEWLDETHSRVDRLASVAGRALKELSEKAHRSGRKADVTLRWLIIKLLEVFKAAGAKKFYTVDGGEFAGPFFDLVEVVLNRVPGEPKRSNAALGKAVQRALKGQNRGEADVVKSLD
jgi:hypothetical protein